VGRVAKRSRYSTNLGVAAHVDPFESKRLKPGDHHMSGSRVGTRRALSSVWVNLHSPAVWGAIRGVEPWVELWVDWCSPASGDARRRGLTTPRGPLRRVGTFSPRYFAVKTPIDDSQYGPRNQSDAAPGSDDPSRAYGRRHQSTTASMVHVTNLMHPPGVTTLVGRMGEDSS
jgi:hypothetical protein